MAVSLGRGVVSHEVTVGRGEVRSGKVWRRSGNALDFGTYLRTRDEKREGNASDLDDWA